jgi:hypothetical protein
MSIQLKSTAVTAALTAKKICIHGQSGIGKTMLAATAAPFKPLIILTEKTGDETLAPQSIVAAFGADRADILYDIDLIEAFEPEQFTEAVRFAIESTDHDLIIFDSMSKGSRLILKQAKRENAHGLKAYGQHNDEALSLIEELLESDKHVVLLAHTSRQEDSDTNEVCYFPSFEGKAFAEKFVYDMPHVLFMENVLDDDTGDKYRALRCHQGDTNKRTKSRGSSLSELEEPHLGRLIQKLQGVSTPKKITKKKLKA